MNVSPTWSVGQVKLLDIPRLITLSGRFRQPADNEVSVTPPHIIKDAPYIKVLRARGELLFLALTAS